MKLLFFTDGPEIPGSRFRCLQFFPHFERRGIRCEARYAYDTRYNDVFTERWAPAYKLWGRLKRAASLVTAPDADLVFVHKTSLAVSGVPEWLRAQRRTPLVFDFDDAIYLGPDGAPQPVRRRAFEQVARAATHLIAGNRHLARVAGREADTTVIPSVVDTDVYTPGPARPASTPLVVGWMGTASNFPSLRPVLPSLLAALERVPRARLRLVSNGELPEYAGHPRVEQWRWNEAGEVRALRSFDVGLMPLDDTELSRGKCGFKMIQYMAVGVPVLASAVGANIDIFAGSDAGALVAPGRDWGAALTALLEQRARFGEIGAVGRAHAVKHFSIDAVVDEYVRLFTKLTK